MHVICRKLVLKATLKLHLVQNTVPRLLMITLTGSVICKDLHWFPVFLGYTSELVLAYSNGLSSIAFSHCNLYVCSSYQQKPCSRCLEHQKLVGRQPVAEFSCQTLGCPRRFMRHPFFFLMQGKIIYIQANIWTECQNKIYFKVLTFISCPPPSPVIGCFSRVI